MVNFWTQATTYLTALKPSDGERILMTIGGTIGAVFSFAVGGVDEAMQWLLILAGLDYVTGTIASFKEHHWCSERGFCGLFKKAFMFVIVAICHGVDVTTGQNFLRDISVFAYAVNEAGSIIENVGRMGYAHWIPPFLRAGLKILKDKEEELLKKGAKKHDS